MVNTYKKNKEVLKYCPNYYKISSFEYYEDDNVSERLVSIYQAYITSVNLENKEQLSKLRMIDKVINKYIDDYNFRFEIKKGLTTVRVRRDEKNLLEVLVSAIISLFDNYETTFTRTIYIARWI